MKYIVRTTFLLAAMAVMTVFSGCGKSGKDAVPSFNNTEEALQACRQELYRVATTEKATLKDVARICNHWMELQDSCEAVTERDTAFVLGGSSAAKFIGVSDSIMEYITTLATEEDHTVAEVVQLKCETAPARKALQESEAYREAVKLFGVLDRNELCKNLDETVARFDKLLKKDIATDTKGFFVFLKEEDICFRSLMAFLPEATDKVLGQVAEKSQKAFLRLSRKLQRDVPEEQQEMIELFMTMRVNRRVLQNAEACRRDIMNGKKLSDQAVMNYRWMLIQPVMALGSVNMAVLTDEQQKKLLNLAQEMPKLLLQLDGKKPETIKRSELERIDHTLAAAILQNHLMEIL